MDHSIGSHPKTPLRSYYRKKSLTNSAHFVLHQFPISKPLHFPCPFFIFQVCTHSFLLCFTFSHCLLLHDYTYKAKIL